MSETGDRSNVLHSSRRKSARRFEAAYRLPIVLAALLFAVAASAEDEPIYFLDNSSFSPDFIRFHSGWTLGERTNTPARSVIVVYRGAAKAHAGGVAHFVIDEHMACDTKQLTTAYTTFAESGAVMARSSVVPDDIRQIADPTPFDWANRCQITTGGRLPPPVVVAPNPFKLAVAHGQGEALALAVHRDSEIEEAQALPDVGRFVVFDEAPTAVTLVDYAHSELSGAHRRVAWLTVNPIRSAVSYIRAIWTIDCEAETGAREIAASYDSTGAMTRLDGASAVIKFAQLGSYGGMLKGVCGLDRPGMFEREYKSLDAALLRGRENFAE